MKKKNSFDFHHIPKLSIGFNKLYTKTHNLIPRITGFLIVPGYQGSLLYHVPSMLLKS